MRLVGVDEAGRGPVLGPLVIAGVAIDDPSQLAHLDVRDSKALTDKRRRHLAPLIREAAAATSVSVISAERMNAERPVNLDEQTYIAYARVIDELRPGRVIMDTCGPVQTCEREVAARSSWNCVLVAEKEADTRHQVVSAASILAKVARDDEMLRLHELHGDCGSGYPGDKKTRAFLASWMAEQREPPSFSRVWYSTVAPEGQKGRRRGGSKHVRARTS